MFPFCGMKINLVINKSSFVNANYILSTILHITYSVQYYMLHTQYSTTCYILSTVLYVTYLTS